MAAVELENLSKIFTLSRGWGCNRTHKEIVAVDGISLTVPDGQAIAFIGPNGAGKSTTIKMLTGILQPTSGTARLLGLNPWRNRRELAYQIGVVFGQRSQLWYHLPPRDTLELLARIYNLNRQEYIKRRDQLVERFDLSPFWNTPVRKLSLGQRMRAEVAASLLHAPKVLFLDEPTIGLDVIARQELRDLIREWNRDEGVTVFLTSHDAGDIEQVAQRVVVINHGRVVLDDKVSAMRRQYLGSKILSVKFHTSPAQISLPGVTQLKAGEYGLKLEVNTRITPIETVMTKILQAGSVADIAIEDPPLEEVIAHIYAQAAS
ncbi:MULTISPECIES: ATP-binding cassette domain-containing protein [unclassified Nostoc]|uniref:ABC transporter ATP-binding protein n=1 Tax=unclassified Nostoc TaxID=2593658 RepID=UPI002AD4361E|nr:ATP-binding cassette domain-containing protein [Nostoc sp. DedQUE03]MDZ7973277.1 ATP-binding cassette domain-containing protein [Nostoc sp. DedQUE03]MDZ8049536.1 ATP-binding cassette domain-containing protein [Nostoc sp. DedQUE02]